MVANKRIGTWVSQRISQEPFKAYVPPKLPLLPPLDLAAINPRLEAAAFSLAQLNAIAKSIPNTVLFTYMYVRKEALLSSQIEGTQSSFSDLMLFEHQLKPDVALDDVEEVSNYVKAISHGLERLRGGFPLSLRLLREIHSVLLTGARGATKLPGEFRRSQNWIGGTRPGNALFVPPPVEYLDECLANLESFLHDDSLPVLIKAGIAHLQFETIHPFLDGNGRLGRLLITLLLCHANMLDEPILYLSLYLKQNRQLYYNLLQEVRTEGTWETWLEFFLDGVCQSSKQAVQTALKINALFTQDLATLSAMGRAGDTCRDVLEYLKRLPQVSVPLLVRELGITAPTARRAVEAMRQQGILSEITGKQRDRIYVYRRYLALLEEGAEPFPVDDRNV